MGATLMAQTPPLPPGFVLSGGASSPTPPLPPGFQLKNNITAESNDRERITQGNLDSMSEFEKFAVGMGRGFNDVGQGIKQLGLQAGEKLGVVPQGRAAKYTKKVEDELSLFDPLKKDSPLLTGAGRILGNVAAMPIPAVGGATLAAKAASAALAGGAQGAAQFAREGESRLANASIGATVGALLPGLLKGGQVTTGAVKKVSETLKSALPAVSSPARDKMAAKILRDAMANPENIAKLNQSTQIVPGTIQTLAEATDDKGLAGLQNTLQNMSPDFKNRIAGLAEQNNAARVGLIKQGFGGADEASAKAIEAARDKATAPLLEAAKLVNGVNVKPVIKLANNIIKSREGNDSVVSVVSKVKDILNRDGMDTVQKLHNTRQEIGNILSGNSESTQAGKAATRELMAIRSALDSQIGKSSPEFRQFLKQYADISKDAGRVRMGEELLGKSANNLDSLGNPILSPAKFAGAANDLDRVAKAATGFKKESADRLMTDEQKSIVGNIRADLDRVARLQRSGLSVGSNTVQNAAGMGRLQDAATGGQNIQAALLPNLTGVLSVFNGIKQRYGEKVLNSVREAMLNPQEATRVLSTLSKVEQQKAKLVMQNPQVLKAMQTFQTIGPSVFSAASIGE